MPSSGLKLNTCLSKLFFHHVVFYWDHMVTKVMKGGIWRENTILLCLVHNRAGKLFPHLKIQVLKRFCCVIYSVMTKHIKSINTAVRHLMYFKRQWVKHWHFSCNIFMVHFCVGTLTWRWYTHVKTCWNINAWFS